MDSAAHSKGRKPVATVTVGSVTIPIYSSPVTVKVAGKNGASESSAAATRIYPSYQVSHYEGDHWILQRRNTLEKVKVLAKKLPGVYSATVPAPNTTPKQFGNSKDSSIPRIRDAKHPVKTICFQ